MVESIMSLGNSRSDIETKLLKVLVVMESLIDEVHGLAMLIESGADTEKNVGFKPRVYQKEQSFIDVQKSNSETLIHDILSGKIRAGEIAKHL